MHVFTGSEGGFSDAICGCTAHQGLVANCFQISRFDIVRHPNLGCRWRLWIQTKSRYQLTAELRRPYRCDVYLACYLIGFGLCFHILSMNPKKCRFIGQKSSLSLFGWSLFSIGSFGHKPNKISLFPTNIYGDIWISGLEFSIWMDPKHKSGLVCLWLKSI